LRLKERGRGGVEMPIHDDGTGYEGYLEQEAKVKEGAAKQGEEEKAEVTPADPAAAPGPTAEPDTTVPSLSGYVHVSPPRRVFSSTARREDVPLRSSSPSRLLQNTVTAQEDTTPYQSTTVSIGGRAYLIARAAGGSKKVPLPTEEGQLFSIGRAPLCSLQVVAGADVGRVHCCIRFVSEPYPQYTLFDLASQNGVTVNGVRVGTHANLRHGDRLALNQIDPNLQFTFMERTEGRRSSPPRAMDPTSGEVTISPGYNQDWRKESKRRAVGSAPPPRLGVKRSMSTNSSRRATLSSARGRRRSPQ